MKYLVKITEINEAWHEVEAESEDQAIAEVEEKYEMDCMRAMKNGNCMTDFTIDND
jgi:hypothetical protein